MVWLANSYFANDSIAFPVLLRFCGADPGRSFDPLHRYFGPIARTRRRSFHNCGVASAQAPTPDRESLPATITESARVRSNSRRLDCALDASSSTAAFRNRTETLDTALPAQNHEQAKVPDAVLTERHWEARPERTERGTHPCGRGNEAT